MTSLFGLCLQSTQTENTKPFHPANVLKDAESQDKLVWSLPADYPDRKYKTFSSSNIFKRCKTTGQAYLVTACSLSI